MKKIDIAGQKFNKLTVIGPGPNKKNGRTSWNCQCECGNIINVRTNTLRQGKQKSCGCTYLSNGKVVKPGDKYNKLTAVKYSNGKWTCKCECGKEVHNVLTHRLVGNKIKSCGCIKGDVVRENSKKSIRKYDPRVASARRRWKGYLYQDKECNLSFEDWYKLSQENCYYCGVGPSNTFNYFSKKKYVENDIKLKGNFAYNGIDRVDSSKPHIKGNVVACCLICNRAKNNRTIDEYKNYINKLKIFDGKIKNIKIIDLPKGYILTSIKDAYRHYKRNYKIMELSLEEFYSYSQVPCTYCGEEKINCLNTYLNDKKMSQKGRDAAYFNYNGVDRIDSGKGHTKDNIVPCCKYCNFGKAHLSLDQFNEWIIRIKTYLESL